MHWRQEGAQVLRGRAVAPNAVQFGAVAGQPSTRRELGRGLHARPHDHLKAAKERLATVIAIGTSAIIHLFVFIGGIQLYHWAEEEEKRERLMVIHRVPEAPPDEPRPSAPAPARRQASMIRRAGTRPP